MEITHIEDFLGNTPNHLVGKYWGSLTLLNLAFVFLMEIEEALVKRISMCSSDRLSISHNLSELAVFALLKQQSTFMRASEATAKSTRELLETSYAEISAFLTSQSSDQKS